MFFIIFFIAVCSCYKMMKMRKSLSSVRDIPPEGTPSTVQSVSSAGSVVTQAQTWHHLNLVSPPAYNTLMSLDKESPPSYEDYIKNNNGLYLPQSQQISDNSNQGAQEIYPSSTEEEYTN